MPIRPGLLSHDPRRTALAIDRLMHTSWEDYKTTSSNSPLECQARYLWNIALGKALFPAFHAVEITLKNAIYRTVTKTHPISPGCGIDVDCWLDFKRPILAETEQVSVAVVKRELQKRGQVLSPHALVNGLGFGFWSALFSTRYGYRGGGPEWWPTLLPRVFPNLPKHMRQRAAVAQTVRDAKEFRNITFHHRPIWSRNLKADFDNLLQLLHWMDSTLADFMLAESNFPDILHYGPRAFLPKLTSQ